MADPVSSATGYAVAIASGLAASFLQHIEPRAPVLVACFAGALAQFVVREEDTAARRASTMALGVLVGWFGSAGLEELWAGTPEALAAAVMAYDPRAILRLIDIVLRDPGYILRLWRGGK